jgi:TPP-dependent pyruvate/acetoin dehydrogenase alpha subunit
MTQTEPSRTDWLRTSGVAALEAMLLIRELDGRLDTYVDRRLINGSTHPYVGMEAVAVGVSLCLEPRDCIVSTHRGHGHCLARGAEPSRLLAELFGRSSGYCQGKGGSMHVASKELGILGTNGIVGASIGLATGAALAAKLASDASVSVAFFGDGAVNQGIFHEALNLAAIWTLPCLYVCENNHYAQSAAIEQMVAIPDLARRADSYGIPAVSVDGMDVFAVWRAANSAVARARAGAGPTLLVADTWRYLGHMVGDTEIYRSSEIKDPWSKRDPIEALEAELIDQCVIDADDAQRARDDAAQRVDAAEREAIASDVAPTAVAFQGVYGATDA